MKTLTSNFLACQGIINDQWGSVSPFFNEWWWWLLAVYFFQYCELEITAYSFQLPQENMLQHTVIIITRFQVYKICFVTIKQGEAKCRTHLRIWWITLGLKNKPNVEDDGEGRSRDWGSGELWGRELVWVRPSRNSQEEMSAVLGRQGRGDPWTEEKQDWSEAKR